VKPANNAPVYVCVYAKLAEIAREHGYALAIHGSLARDCDLICIPWIEWPSQPSELMDAITKKFAFKRTGGPTTRPHGRVAFTLHFDFGDVYLDLQFMPAKQYADPQRPRLTDLLLPAEVNPT
jgi:hypothetical protein